MNVAKTRRLVGIITAVLAVVLVGCSQDWSSVCPAKGSTVLSAYIPARSLSEYDETSQSRKGDRDMALGAGDTVVWNGSTDTDYENTLNWSPQEIPIDQVHLLVADNATHSILLNVDRTADSGGNGLDLRSIFNPDASTIDIGASGAPLRCTVDNAPGDVALPIPSITHRGHGSLYFSSEIGGGGARTTGIIVINSPNTDDAAIISGEFITGIDKISCLRGHTLLSAALQSSVDWIFVTERSIAHPTHLEIAAYNLAHDRIFITGGTVNSARAFNYINVYGGVWTQTDKAALVVRQSGGVFVFNSDDTLATAVLLGGIFDARDNAVQKTITNLYKGPGATLRRDWTLTVTNEYDIFDEDVE